MDLRRFTVYLLQALLTCIFIPVTFANNYDSVKHLKSAYPEHVREVTDTYIAWNDGTRMLLGESSAFSSLFKSKSDKTKIVISNSDIEHERYEPFFKKMYGNTPKEVRANLVTIYWMPNVFGKSYPLRVTTINGVDEKLKRISANLEKLPSKYHKYLKKPGGSYYWRKVKGESSLSSHSFGIAIDINLRYSNYWLWDYMQLKRPIADLRKHTLKLKNRIPKEIVEVFEKEGFFWGGRWYFYDTMHFEYRPDLLLQG